MPVIHCTKHLHVARMAAFVGRWYAVGKCFSLQAARHKNILNPTFLIKDTESSREVDGDFFRWNIAVSSISSGAALVAPSLESVEVCLRSGGGLEAACKCVLYIALLVRHLTGLSKFQRSVLIKQCVLVKEATLGTHLHLQSLHTFNERWLH